MTECETRVNTPLEAFQANATICRPWSTTCGAKVAERSAWAAARRRSSATRHRAASCCRASASTRCSTPARRSWSCRNWPPRVYGERAGRRHHHRHRPRRGQRVHDRRQRRHGEGRHLLPADGEEAPARAGPSPRQNHLPCIYLVDSGGAFLPRRTRSSPTASISAASSTTRPTCRRGHPADRRGDGLLHRRRRLRAGDGDESIIVKNQGTIFLGGPPLVKAATGEVVTAEELGGADVHTRTSGVADHYANNDTTRWNWRGASWPASTASSPSRAGPAEPVEPLYDPRELYGIVPATPNSPTTCARSSRASSTARNSTSSRRATAPRWSAASPASTATRSASSPTTASCSANRRRRARTSSSCAAQRKIPLVFLQNITGFMVGKKYEAGGIAKHGAKLVTAVACARRCRSSP
jgi:hypothetical protein